MAGATVSDFKGVQGANPLIKPTPTGDVTPYIPDLAGGAEVYGLLDGLDANAPDFDALRAGAPDDALAGCNAIRGTSHHRQQNRQPCPYHM